MPVDFLDVHAQVNLHRQLWNEHLRRATSEPLNPRWFVEQFVEA